MNYASTKMAYVNRDPFARTELHKSVATRAKDNYGRMGCDWCGSEGCTLYTYRTESDGGRKSEHKGKFCCKSCHDSYHGV